MDKDWNVRLKQAREDSGLTLKEISAMSVFDMSQQSLIKYESGEVFPRIDLLDKMCKKYNVTIDYILYGSSELSKTNDINSQLVSLFMLMYSNRLQYNSNDNTLRVNDTKLTTQIKALAAYIENKEISSIEDLTTLIKGIKKLTDEK